MTAARRGSFPTVSLGKGFAVFSDCASVGAAVGAVGEVLVVLLEGVSSVLGRGGPTISGRGGPTISGGEVGRTSDDGGFHASSCWRNSSLTRSDSDWVAALGTHTNPCVQSSASMARRNL